MTGTAELGAAPARCVVFGGSSGIGAAVATLMAEQGCHVVAASRRATAPPGTNATPEHCDIRDADSVARVLQDTLDGGDIDWIVNAAGVGYYAPIDERYAPQWQQILDTNLLGTLTVLAQTRMLPTPVRHFVQIGSLAGTRPSQTPGNDVYSATKAAGALLLARHRAELRADGVPTKITLITPGYVGNTGFGRNFFAHAPDRRRPILDRFPPLSPVDVARTVAYALTQPDHVELSEIVVRPVEQPD
ncbi:MAG: SDR family oxidoreductase [Pseudonocardiaceae bacterium]